MSEDLLETCWTTKCKFHTLNYPKVVYRGKGIIATGNLNHRTELNLNSTVKELYTELDELSVIASD